MKQFSKMKATLILTLLFILILGIGLFLFYYRGGLSQEKKIESSSKNESPFFSYQDMLFLFATIEYEADRNKKKQILLKQFNLENKLNQNKYVESFEHLFDTQKKWYEFIKKTIDYYIQSDKNIQIKYYYPQAYEKRFNKFNENYRIQYISQSQLPRSYWKVSYFLKKDNRLSSRFFSQELYEDGRLMLRTFYQKRSASKIKEEDYSSTKETIDYFYRGIRFN